MGRYARLMAILIGITMPALASAQTNNVDASDLCMFQHKQVETASIEPSCAGSGPHRVHSLRRFIPAQLSGPQILSFAGSTARPIRLEGEEQLDVRFLWHVYALDGPLMTSIMTYSDIAAYPVFFGAPAVMWLGALTNTGIERSEALEMSGAWLGAVGSAMVLKHLIKRGRPFSVLSGIQAKTKHVGARNLDSDASMPSGHAAIAFALATTVSLQHKEWFFVAPSALLATTIATSRVWLGVHYPSDIAAGAVLGISSAVLVHILSQ